MATPKSMVRQKVLGVSYRSRRERRREQIIKIASGLISEKGYHDDCGGNC